MRGARRRIVPAIMWRVLPAFWTCAKAEQSWSRKYNAKAFFEYQRISDQETSNFYRLGFQTNF